MDVTLGRRLGRRWFGPTIPPAHWEDESGARDGRAGQLAWPDGSLGWPGC